MGQNGNMAVHEKRRHPRNRRLTVDEDDTDDDTFFPSGHTHVLSDLRSQAQDRIRKQPRENRAKSAESKQTKAEKSGAPELPKFESIQPLKSFRPPSGKTAHQRTTRSAGDLGSRESLASDTNRSSCSSIVDGLLFEIYDRWTFSRRDSFDSDTTFTEYSSTSDAFLGRSDSLHIGFVEKHSEKLNKKFLLGKDVSELRQLRSVLQHRVTQNSARLIRQLKNRDRRRAKLNKHCDILTAILQASSLKRRIDSKIKFSIEPLSGEDTFDQWRDAMKAVARLPLGIPAEFRKKVWLALADKHISNLKVDWEQTKKLAFNERSNPDDNTLGLQIVKDLHRTGCSGFSGTDNEQDRAVLKRVLLAYARWNKKVGYCQGFNVLAALILDVVNRKEDDALKVMIYLVDHVLPESYFANNLRALSVDMAVFRDLLHLQVPQLSKHLDHLQSAARDVNTGANYEPPLTNVFTMQWFLTMFATCLPKSSALRVWDSVLLEGSEILLRTAVAIWGTLQNRIMGVQSADEFYTTMGTLTHEMLGSKIIEADDLIKTVYLMAPVPFPQLSELREKYTYNITPFSAAMSTGQRPNRPATSIFSDEDDFDDEDFAENINCFTGIFPPQTSPSRRGLGDLDKSQSGSSFDISKVSPGAYGAQPEVIGPLASAYTERMSLDIDQLKKQYKRLRHRQNQAHIILTAASAKHNASKGVVPAKIVQKTKQQAVVAPIQSPVAVNHLFIGRQMLADGKRNKAVAQAPHIAPFYPKHNFLPTPIRPRSQSEAQDGYQFRITKSGLVVPDSEGGSGLKKSPSRCMSVDSSGSGHSTLQSYNRSDSTSDISTYGVDSDIGQSDVESLCAQDVVIGEVAYDVPDLINLDLEKGEASPATSEGDMNRESSDSGEESRAVSVLPINGHTDCRQSASPDTEGPATLLPDMESPIRIQVQEPEEQESVGNKESSVFRAKQHMHLDLDVNKPSSPGTNQTGAYNVCSNHSKMTLLELAHGTRDSDVVSSPEGSKGKVTDPETHYVASLTYKTQKALHSPNSPVSGPVPASSHNHSPQPANQEKASARSPKTFNPFPGQHVNSRRLQNGLKLGLYSANNVPKLELGINKPFNLKNIGRAQINACLHRQYMEEIKQQAKSSKR